MYNIVVIGIGYVGLAMAVLLSQNNHVTAIDVLKEKVDLLNQHKSPIKDEYIEPKNIRLYNSNIRRINNDKSCNKWLWKNWPFSI